MCSGTCGATLFFIFIMSGESDNTRGRGREGRKGRERGREGEGRGGQHTLVKLFW